MSGLSPEARAVLAERAAAGGRPMHEAPVEESRAAQWEWVPYLGEPAAVASVVDRFIPSRSAEIPVRVYTPYGEGPFPALVMFHGGCWMVGNIDLADGPHRLLARATACVVVAVNYQKAPEHPFPVPLEDAYAGYRWTVDHAAELDLDRTRIGVAGDSAGGNLAAAVCLRARELEEQEPAAQILIYPALDPELGTPSAHDFAEGYGLTRADMLWTWHQYVPDESLLTSAAVAPARAASLEGLPPAVVVTAGFDILRDEGQAYAARLADAGVPVVPLHFPGEVHGFFWMAGRVPAATTMVEEVAEGLDRLWGR